MLSSKQISLIDKSVENVLHRLCLQDLKNKRLFITGGTGFFGLWLLSTLRALNADGFGIDICVLSRDPEAFIRRYPQFQKLTWLRFVKGNVVDFEIPSEHFDLAIHAATETSTEAHSRPMKMFDDIVSGTRRVLELAKKCDVARVLLISSGAVYGPMPPGATHQPDDSLFACDTLNPANAYGEGKRVMELLGGIMQKETGIDCIVARCFAFCGPGLPIDAHFAIGNFIRDALFEKQITVEGDGSAIRSYLYGADLAVWLLYLLIRGEAGKSYNVGSDIALSIGDLAITVRNILSPKKNVEFKLTNQTGSTRSVYVPSINEARSMGCNCWTSLDQAIRITGRYFSGDMNESF